MKIIKSFEKEDLSNKIEDNKEIMLPLIVLFAGIFLILFVIVPQLFSAPRKFSERNTEVARLKEIKQAKDILERTNDTELTSQVETVSNALPTDRNFEAIFNAIATAANLSNAQISGYKFSDIAAPQSEGGQSEVSRALAFKITINGTPDQAALFIEELYKMGPISSIKSIDYLDGQTELAIDFFYKPFTALDQNTFLPKELTPEQQKIYNEIQNFTKPISEPITDFPEEASSSALPVEN